MGLLNDAIREHLELKRLRGVDPSEMAREEQDALGPAHRGESAAFVEHGADPEETSAVREGRVFDKVEVHSDPDLSHLSQETVELDMRAVLEAESIEEGDGHAEPDRLSPMVGSPGASQLPAPTDPGVTLSRHRALLTSYQGEGTHRQWANRPGSRLSSPVHHRLNRL